MRSAPVPPKALPPLAALAALALAACAGPHVSISGEPKYAKSAEENYQFGLEVLGNDSYPEATKFFEHVKTKYPYSKWAALADLRLADVKFDQERFTEAADAYRSFLKLHPTHHEADYAAYRVGLAHFREAPTDFVLFPPAHEKDQVELRKAIGELKGFLEARPDSSHAGEARKTLAEARTRLADHEWYVAHFYRKRGRWAGAAGRLQTIVTDYPGYAREGEALYLLADAYVHLNERYRAQQALQQLIVKHPGDPRRTAAEKLLGALR